MNWVLRCVVCSAEHSPEGVRYRCGCGGTLDVAHPEGHPAELTTAVVDERRRSLDPLDRSGVWRFREWILPGQREHVVTRQEGNTGLYDAPRVASWCGVDALQLKHEGDNPTGSFKDRGMTTAVTMARRHGMRRVACASTGNTSASMASYAATAGMQALVFVPDGKIAYGKLSQALAYGAKTLQIPGDFDAAMAMVQQVCAARGIYLLNSVNPYRIEGQKAIGFEILEDLGWQIPDWIVLPGGNLGNSSAIAKGLLELHRAGIIDRLPRMAVVQAAGANPLYRAWIDGTDVVPVTAQTRASAIRIGAPVSWRKCLRGLGGLDGVVEQVTDQEIFDAKARIDAQGIGAEPASCASVAGLRKLVGQGTIRADERVVAVLTGHVLKDPDQVVAYHRSSLEGIEASEANPPVRAPQAIDDLLRLLDAV